MRYIPAVELILLPLIFLFFLAVKTVGDFFSAIGKAAKELDSRNHR